MKQPVSGRVAFPDLAPSLLPGRVRSVVVLSGADSFDRIYDANAGFVWRVLRGMGVADGAVEDAVQDVFVVVHRRLSEFDGKHPVKTWLFAIAYRVACDYHRKQKRTRTQEPLDESVRDRAPTPADVAERTEGLRILAELLDGLSDDKRAVLVLAEIEEMTVPEIAATIGIPLNTAYTRLRRARSDLNDALARRRKGAR